MIKTKSNGVFWCFFILICVAEYLLFNRFVANNITHYYPVSFDQASYLPVLYLYYENIKQAGLIQGLLSSPSLATGILFPIQSVFAFLLFGASRYSVLLVNLIYFMVLQFVTLLALKSITKRNDFAISFLGLLLALNTPFLIYGGGLFDVRMDFMTFCLYGIFIGLVILSRFFASRPLSMLIAAVVSLSILLRSLTLVYFVGVLGSLFIYLWMTGHQKQRMMNLLLAASLILAVTIPLIWMNRMTLYNYYFVGHVFGEEKYIRLSEVGVTNTFMALIYYPAMLVKAHFGKMAFILAVSLFIFFVKKRKLSLQSDQLWKMGLFFLAASFFVPMIILTLDVSKSPIVGGIMVMPALWLLFWAGIKMKESSPAFYWLGAPILVAGLYFHWHELHHHHSQNRLAELEKISRLYSDVGNYAANLNKPVVSIAFDHISEYLTSGGIATLYYEETGKLLNLAVERLGGIIFPITLKEGLASLERADIFVMNLNEYTVPSPYPFDKSVALIHPQLQVYAEKYFHQLGDYELMNGRYRVYVR